MSSEDEDDDIIGVEVFTDANGRRTVPLDRFQKVAAQRREVRSQLGAMTREQQAWAAKEQAWAAKEQALAAKEQEWAAKEQAWTAKENTWAEERAFMGAGLADEEAQDVARALYSRLPEDKRPKGGLAEWLKGIRDDPANAPRSLRPFLEPGTGAGAGDTKRQTRREPADGDRRVTGNETATVEAMAAARARGDHETAAKIRAALMAQR